MKKMKTKACPPGISREQGRVSLHLNLHGLEVIIMLLQ